tara:strand:- start:2964 stop:3359 length:396 start_codon:yes stop_codon:yes gene_type:complete
MKYDIKEIWQQGIKDPKVFRGGTANCKWIMRKGIQMERCKDDYRISNMTLGGMYYKELSLEEYEIFLSKGWQRGVYEVAVENAKRQLDKVEKKTKEEVNHRKNTKYFQTLKTARQRIMSTYSKLLREFKNN